MAKSDEQIIHTAETIGAALGEIAAKVDAWKRQHSEITAQLRSLTRSAKAIVAGVRAAARQEKKRGATRNGDGMPVAAHASKAKIQATWRAQREKAQAVGSQTTKPSDARSAIRATEGKRWTARQPGKG